MPWYWEIAEHDHEIQNPTSPEKIRHIGRLLALGPDSRVLDVACGKAGPALVLAAEFGCSVLGVERAPEFVEAARARVAAAGLTDRIEIVEGDASAFPLEAEAWDAALCLGASFVYHDLAGTLGALTPAVRPGGCVAVGEPYWREWPLPREVEDQGYLPLLETTRLVESAGLALVGLVDASLDDWDSHESQHWRAVEDWLASNPDDPETVGIRERHERARDDYLRWERRLLGWAVFAGRKV
jgi:SAM-dependent methyltransferase